MNIKGDYKIFLIFLAIVVAGIYFFRDGIGGLSYRTEETEKEDITFDTAQDITDESEEEETPEEETVSLPIEESAEEMSLPPTATIVNVPFTSQAPFGDWADPRQQHGCEEASLLMAHYWMQAKKLTKETALLEIFAMSEYEEANYGGAHDLSLEDTLKFYREYYGYKKSFTKYDISAQDIKREIAQGNPVITPMDGRKLGNPQYTAPGPELHELIVIGYDDGTGEFITNDPGTRFGEGYRYDYEIFMDSIRDYKTGFDEPIDTVLKAMLVIEKE
ncbi:MAG: C39 family peptidase [Candidatus Pacebacteria bacterium]|jgi:hypothetical protein|nr:C39 family peptidase [Candidatus Paceibacterota bacterium]